MTRNKTYEIMYIIRMTICIISILINNKRKHNTHNILNKKHNRHDNKHDRHDNRRNKHDNRHNKQTKK